MNARWVSPARRVPLGEARSARLALSRNLGAKVLAPPGSRGSHGARDEGCSRCRYALGKGPARTIRHRHVCVGGVRQEHGVMRASERVGTGRRGPTLASR